MNRAMERGATNQQAQHMVEAAIGEQVRARMPAADEGQRIQARVESRLEQRDRRREAARERQKLHQSAGRQEHGGQGR